MATEIDIVISAQDRFGPVFDRLAGAFDRVRGLGGQARSALDGMGAGLEGVAQSAGAAETTVKDFVTRTNEQWVALAEERQAIQEQMAQQQEDFSRSLEERLLAIDEEMASRREALQERSHQRMSEAQAAFFERMLNQKRAYGQKMSDIETAISDAQRERNAWFFETILNLARKQGGALAQLAKTVGVSRALVEAYVAANNALASVPYPFNLPAAALVLAQGLANVERIRRVNVAHGGLEQVPEDATFLLRQGERVLSPAQNRELTAFLSRAPEEGTAHGVTIGNLTIHVLENATTGEALLNMDRAELRRVVSERVIPMLDELARLGIRPHFVDGNL